MLRVTDTDMPSLHLVHDMWDTMTEKIKSAIYQHEKKEKMSNHLFMMYIKSWRIEEQE